MTETDALDRLDRLLTQPFTPERQREAEALLSGGSVSEAHALQAHGRMFELRRAHNGYAATNGTEDGAPSRHDVAAFLDGGMPPPVEPALLRREDGNALFYESKVNVLYGDPECGKTWIALAAVVEALNGGRRAAVIDLDHNGMPEIISRLLALGARPDVLANRDTFWLTEPEDEDSLILEISQLRAWQPAVATVDSLGELQIGRAHV